MTKPRANPLIEPPERPQPKSVAVVGAGTIGPDIAYYLASSLEDVEIVLVDVVQTALDAALGVISGYAAKGVRKRKLSEGAAERVRRSVTGTLDYDRIAGCEWVVEAATENVDLKKKIFGQIESVVGDDALITSNTSSLPASWLFSELRHPERATVTHFFAPAFRNPAVEVVRWGGVDPSVVEHLRWLFCKTGKVPIVTADVVCFLLDRVFDNWCNEAALLLDDSTAAEVDTVAMELVQAGPFFVLNLANGNPIIVEANTVQMNEEGRHYRPAGVFASVSKWRTVGPGQSVGVEDSHVRRIRERLLGVLFSQSVDIVDRGIGTPEDLDLGCVLALGFKKGPLQLMGELGDHDVQRILRGFERERPGMPMPKQDLARYRDVRRHVLVDDVDGVRVLTMRRPQAMNALDDAVTDELLGVIEQSEDDAAVEGFVITGYGPRAFCAGADIGRFPDLLGKADEAAQFARDCSRLLVHLDGMSKPVVAALNGMALGGGLELALRCHGRVALPDVWMQLPEVTLGIAPGIGALVVPFRRWPGAAPVFHDMLRLARKLEAPEARDLGVVDALAEDHASLLSAAVGRVRQLSGGVAPPPDGALEIEPPADTDPIGRRPPLSREVVGIITRAIVDAAAAPSLSEALEVGYLAFGASACTPAAREGIAAFLERRKPDFAKTG